MINKLKYSFQDSFNTIMQLCGSGGQTAAQHLLDRPKYLHEREILLNKIISVLPNILKQNADVATVGVQ